MHAAYEKARRHLGRKDPVLKRVIDRVGHCTLQPHDDRFRLLVRSIISQQISTKAADSIATRLEALMRGRKLTAGAILKLPEETLRGVGLSTAKTRSIRHLSEKVVAREVRLSALDALSDDAVVEHLTPVRGIGRWTAEMFLIFVLGRLDVLPVADLGFRSAVRKEYGLTDMPGHDYLEALGEPWRPYRSVATWYLWRSLSQPPG